LLYAFDRRLEQFVRANTAVLHQCGEGRGRHSAHSVYLSSRSS
jgi:hypothetical protein